MPTSITSKTFLGFVKALLDYYRASAQIYGDTDNLEVYCRTFLVMIVVFIGEHEDHPVIASDIVNYTGMPRTTVQREVDRLERRGLLRTELQGRRKIIMLGVRHDRVQEEHRPILKRFLDRAIRLRSIR